jgi:arylsulfatase A
MNRILLLLFSTQIFLLFSLTGLALEVEGYTPDKVIPYKTIGDTTLSLHIFTPPGQRPSQARPAIVFFFGGGWNGGSPSQFYPHCEYLASRGMVAIAAEYRVKSRTAPIPGPVSWMGNPPCASSVNMRPLSGSTRTGLRPAAVRPGAMWRRPRPPCPATTKPGEDTSVSCLPNALVLFNPVYDNGPEGYGHERVKEYWESFSPLHNLSPEARPPPTVFLGTNDRLIPVSTARAFQEEMERLGVRSELHLYPGKPHGFFNPGNDLGAYYLTMTEADRFLASLGYLQGEPTLEPPGKKPNIVVILCDDLGYGDLSSFGHPHIRTPHLDRMAAHGLKMTSFYSAAPVCSPSRAGLLTGRSPNRAGIYDWIPGGNSRRGDRMYLKDSEVTIPKLLKKAGYQTALSGKWHCNGYFNSDEQPQPDDHGFDHWFATQNNASPNHRNPRNFVRNGEPVGELQGYSCQLVVDEGIRWLENREPELPFFLYVAFHEPHLPIESPPELVEQYRPHTVNEDQAQYFANVANMDAAVGRLLQYLEDHGLDRDTLVLFSSDNGPETRTRYPAAARAWGSPGPLKGMKLWTTEAGFRVSGIAQWPGRIAPGQVSDTPVSALDFLPTFCRLAGVDLPTRELDGTDMSPIFAGAAIPREKPLLWCYYNALNETQVALRDGPWKILARLEVDGEPLAKQHAILETNVREIKKARLGSFELYNVHSDVREYHEASALRPAVFERMKALLIREYTELLDDSPAWPAVESSSR